MTRWIMSGLIVLNLLLGVGVYLRLGERSAAAQIGRPQSDYAAVAGSNGGQGILYILEATSGRLLVIRTDPVNRKVELVTGKNIAEDLRRMR